METLKKVAAHTETVSLGDFLQLEEVFCQRNTQARVNSTAKRLRTNPLPTHQAVVLGRYPNGKTVILDGNTRRLAWQKELAPAPDYVFATIYDVNDDAEAQKIYQSLDSTDAVEKSSDKIYSALKIVYGEHFVDDFQSAAISKGKITSALRYASDMIKDGRRGARGNVSWPRDISNMADVIQYFKWELYAIDEMLVDETHGYECQSNQAKIGAALLLLKKYGITNARLRNGIKRLFHNDVIPEERTSTQNKIDAICWANKHLLHNPIYSNTRNTTREAMKIHFDFYAYFVELWMSGKKFADNQHCRVGSERYAMVDFINNNPEAFQPLESRR